MPTSAPRFHAVALLENSSVKLRNKTVDKPRRTNLLVVFEMKLLRRRWSVCVSVFILRLIFCAMLKRRGGGVRSGPPRRRGRVPVHLEYSLSATVN